MCNKENKNFVKVEFRKSSKLGRFINLKLMFNKTSKYRAVVAVFPEKQNSICIKLEE